jgi:hypothetical protein
MRLAAPGPDEPDEVLGGKAAPRLVQEGDAPAAVEGAKRDVEGAQCAGGVAETELRLPFEGAQDRGEDTFGGLVGVVDVVPRAGDRAGVPAGFVLEQGAHDPHDRDGGRGEDRLVGAVGVADVPVADGESGGHPPAVGAGDLEQPQLGKFDGEPQRVQVRGERGVAYRVGARVERGAQMDVAALGRWAELLKPDGRLVLVEGRWWTGGGLTPDQATDLVLRRRREAAV